MCVSRVQKILKQINRSVFENKFSKLVKVEKIFLELIVLDLEFPLSYFLEVRFFYFTDAASLLEVPLVT